MDTVIWNSQDLRFGDTAVNAWVARSPKTDVLEREMKSVRATLDQDEMLILRHPPSIIGDPVGYSPKGKPTYRPTIQDGELWKVRGIGSFDSIRFAKAIFNAPADEYFREGVGSLEQIIAMLSEAFAERDFRLEYVNPAELLFTLTTVGATVTRRQYALLDKLKDRFFTTDATGKHMKSVHSSSPDSFVIGAL
jgi:hypothetical protein